MTRPLDVCEPTRGWYRVLPPTPAAPYWRTEDGEQIGWQQLRAIPRIAGDLARTTTRAIDALVERTIALELAADRHGAIAMACRTQLLLGEIVGRVSAITRQPVP